VLHWNGTTWAIKPSPNVTSIYDADTGVYAHGPYLAYTMDDWSTTINGGVFNPQGWKYTGSWTSPTTHGMGTGSTPLNAMWGFSGSDIWAVGDWYDGSAFQSLAELWNGSTWTIVPSPDNGGVEGSGDDTVLFGAGGLNGHDVWGVGTYYNGSHYETFAMNWNGTAWSIVASPSVANTNNYLETAAPTDGTSGDFWAVGNHDIGSDTSEVRTLVEEYHC
jgi:hypothetical protein